VKRFVAAAAISIFCALEAQVGIAASALPTTHTVIVAGMKFEPASLTVKRGDRVVWVNRDFFPHTATALDRSFDSGDIGTNAAWTYVADKSGTFSYVCTLHPTMKATLTVK
jgi:plastocyanin